MLAPTRDPTLRGRLRSVAIWQLPTLLLATAVWVALAAGPVDPARADGTALGLGVVLVATIVALGVGWARVGFAWLIVVPALDLAGTAVINGNAQRLLPSAMLLATIPVVWLGFEFGRRGVLLASVGVLGTALGPTFLADAPPPALGMLDVGLTLLIGVGVAIVAGVVGRVLSEGQVRLVGNARRLTQQLDTLEAVMLTVDAAIVVLVDGEVTQMNDEATRLARHAGYDIASADTMPHIYERDGVTPMPTNRRPLVRARAGESFRGLLHYLGPPGDQVAVMASCHQILGDDGERIGTVLVGFDATTLVDAVRVREEFLTTVSHELRTPLTSIVASLEMLHGEIEDVRRGTSNPAVSERLLSIAGRNAGTLLGRINQLLSAAPGAVEEMNPRSTDVGRLTREAMAKHRVHAADRGVVLDLDAREGLEVTLDAVAFERVVDNLVSNAIKYTLPGGRVGVSLSHREDLLHLRVADTGIGMDRDEQRQVFDRFYRSAAVIDAALPGIGIGLTVTKRLVHLLGGHITVDSERGRGTTMEVVLPG